jgi:catechol 2,3-dioxygenase-like lactoylglutathione lyase family enzyme
MDNKTSSSRPYPRTLNHVAVSVSNLEEAVRWYQEVLGFTLIKGTTEFVVDDSLTGRLITDVHGPKLKKMRMAWLTSANQVGFEVFEYGEPKAERRTDSFEYWKSGITHISVTDPNIEGLCIRISESGGKQRSKIWEIIPDKHYKIAFCEDPFGNIIEIYNCSYEQLILAL